ncbi:MAG: UDP-N-acetylglucosamine 2-epimerase (non-hydrolyzing) [Candidatus Omnitrophica bacterium]|nr:UDP-N-acetylglucosamine 2-epimerase (non-hydrolyzing) [Candidatus Omnitrophota bacterium]
MAKIVSIVGARPQFIKLAPFSRALKLKEDVLHIIVHTGQHYDYNMAKLFFDELGIPSPDYHLGVGSGSHGEQTAEMLKGVEAVLTRESPGVVVVFGDTNSTIAGALAAAKLHIPVAHIEAGLRSYNRKMPEEINRVLADHCSDLLLCPTENAVNNLKIEGFRHVVNNGKLVRNTANVRHEGALVVNVGDIMYDSFLLALEIALEKSDFIERSGLVRGQYYLATVHRAENTDDTARLKAILQGLSRIGANKRVVFPVHPRTRKIIESIPEEYGAGIDLIDPVGYFDMIMLEKNACGILTDSGGIQKEAYFCGVPCITLRDETEWEETVDAGCNVLAGADADKILECSTAMERKIKTSEKFFGEGNTSAIAVELIRKVKN